MQIPISKAISYIEKNPMTLESIEESPCSRPHQIANQGKDFNFETLMQQPSPQHGIDEGDDDDGLPKT